MTILHHILQKLVHNTLEVLSWEVLLRVAYSPDLAPSDYHVFIDESRTCRAALWCVRRREEIARCLESPPKDGKIVQQAMERAYFESFYHSSEFKMFS